MQGKTLCDHEAYTGSPDLWLIIISNINMALHSWRISLHSFCDLNLMAPLEVDLAGTTGTTGREEERFVDSWQPIYHRMIQKWGRTRIQGFYFSAEGSFLCSCLPLALTLTNPNLSFLSQRHASRKPPDHLITLVCPIFKLLNPLVQSLTQGLC